MSVRSVLLVLNLVLLAALLGYIAWIVLLRRRDDNAPQNLTPFLDDEDLEGRRLERVLGWALVFAAIGAISLPLYWLREPDRQGESRQYFDERAVERGAVLYANASSEQFDSATSLQCANCHGSDGAGGSIGAVYDPDGDDGPVEPVRVAWRAPALNTVLSRFSPEEVTQILVYGRPGTPMQAWGVAGGGPKNDQSISDLVAFLESIQLSGDKVLAQTDKELAAAREQAETQLSAAETNLASAEENLVEAEQELQQVRADPESETSDVREAEADVDDARAALEEAQARLEWAQQWAASRTDVSDGQLLFELHCARCHTAGWSIFDPAVPDGTRVLGQAGGGGTLGFNLRDGGPVQRFGEGADGLAAQVEFIRAGSEVNKPYGRGGIGSGRMPGFAGVLTDEQIELAAEYEREALNDTVYLGQDDGES